MPRTQTKRAERPFLPATASAKRLGDRPLGSLLSRAAARSLVMALQRNEAEDHWDKELDCAGLAESISAARELVRQLKAHGDLTPIYIPPGKEDSARGRLATQVNAARERMKQYEAQ